LVVRKVQPPKLKKEKKLFKIISLIVHEHHEKFFSEMTRFVTIETIDYIASADNAQPKALYNT